MTCVLLPFALYTGWLSNESHPSHHKKQIRCTSIPTRIFTRGICLPGGPHNSIIMAYPIEDLTIKYFFKLKNCFHFKGYEGVLEGLKFAFADIYLIPHFLLENETGTKFWLTLYIRSLSWYAIIKYIIDSQCNFYFLATIIIYCCS